MNRMLMPPQKPSFARRAKGLVAKLQRREFANRGR